MLINLKSKTILLLTVIVVLVSISTVIGAMDAQKSTLAQRKTTTDTQTFVTYKYIDPMTGMEAFRLLIPKSWRAEGSITWSSNPALPAQSRFRFYNPEGSEELNFFPTQCYFWTNNPTFLRTNPPGSLRFGTLVAKPIDLHSVFTKVIIPGAKRNMSGLAIITEKEVPELANSAKGNPAAGVQASARGGKIRIGYQESGKQMEEEIYAAVSQFITQMRGSQFTGNSFINYWYIDDIFSFRDQKGKLDSRSKIFQTMIYSMKVNPRWFAKVVNVKEILAQNAIRGIKAVGRIGDTIAKAGSNMREEQQRDWERRQKAQDKIVENFSDHIRGVERYNDPRAGKEVELPAGYGHAWSNNLGEYVVTESPSYNPNIGSNLRWEQLELTK